MLADPEALGHDPCVSEGVSEGEEKRGFRWPSRRIWIRVVLYGVAISYFGYAALTRNTAVHDAEFDSLKAKAIQLIEHPPRQVVLPDGSTMPVFELTEEEFEAQFGESPPKNEPAEFSAPAKPEPAPQPNTDPAANPEPEPAPD